MTAASVRAQWAGLEPVPGSAPAPGSAAAHTAASSPVEDTAGPSRPGWLDAVGAAARQAGASHQQHTRVAKRPVPHRMR